MATEARRRRTILVATLLAVYTISASSQSSLDYPGWRGQQRDGSASAFTEPASWPERLVRRWSVGVGEGYATPIVVGDMVYAFTRRDANEVMLAVRVASGEVAWQTGYAAPFAPQYNARAHGSGPKSTPVFYSGKLYALGINGTMTAFDAATGKIVWQKPAPSEQPEYGAASSPVAEKGLVMVHHGNYEPLTAFDANTGDVKWKAGDAGAFASPVLVDIAGVRHVVTVTQRSIAGISLDGKVLWTYPWPRDISAITPVAYGDMVIVGSQNARVAAVKVTGRGGRLSADTGWESPDIQLYISNPVIVGDTLFGVSRRGGGQLFSLDAKTGKARWLGSPRQVAHAAIAKANNLIFVLSEGGDLIVGRNTETGFDVVKQYKVADTATWAQPAISGNRFFVKDASSLTLWTLN